MNNLFQKTIRCTVLVAGLSSLALFSGCSTNPATGEQQFTALMSPGQETRIGATEHKKVAATYGLLPANDPLQRYVEQVGQRLARNTERTDVNYQFFVVDDPMVNAFALPGGYVYVSRGLLAQANSEAELAGVVAHEIGHITARHSAERYSQGMLSTLGVMAVGLVLDAPQAGRLAHIGSDLLLKSYSRGQELEADQLGIRYLDQAGYSPYAMASFLENLAESDALERRLAGTGDGGFGFFATHPPTTDRFSKALAIAAQYGEPGKGRVDRNEYLSRIDGMTYGSSARHGFVRGNSFYHPGLDFTFSVPAGYTIHNQPDQVVASSPDNNAVAIFDAAANKNRLDPLTYLTQLWLDGAPASDAERITINGRQAATASFSGQLNGRPVTVRLVAVAWSPEIVYRFQIAMPRNAPSSMVEDLQRTTYSLRNMTDQEKNTVKPYELDVVTARPGDTVASLAQQMAFDTYKEERFRVLNGLTFDEEIVAGQAYKIVRSE